MFQLLLQDISADVETRGRIHRTLHIYHDTANQAQLQHWLIVGIKRANHEQRCPAVHSSTWRHSKVNRTNCCRRPAPSAWRYLPSPSPTSVFPQAHMAKPANCRFDWRSRAAKRIGQLKRKKPTPGDGSYCCSARVRSSSGCLVTTKTRSMWCGAVQVKSSQMGAGWRSRMYLRGGDSVNGTLYRGVSCDSVWLWSTTSASDRRRSYEVAERTMHTLEEE